MIYVGKGQLSVREFRGNFFINNYIQDRIELPELNITATKTTDTITLTYGTYEVQICISCHKTARKVLSVCQLSFHVFAVFVF